MSWQTCQAGFATILQCDAGAVGGGLQQQHSGTDVGHLATAVPEQRLRDGYRTDLDLADARPCQK